MNDRVLFLGYQPQPEQYDIRRPLAPEEGARIPPAPGDEWRFNVFRIKRPGGPQAPAQGAIFAAFSKPAGPSFHDPAAFRAWTLANWSAIEPQLRTRAREDSPQGRSAQRLLNSVATQVGFYLPANGSTWGAYWSPTDPTRRIVYTADARERPVAVGSDHAL